jgi:hypothetical protein
MYVSIFDPRLRDTLDVGENMQKESTRELCQHVEAALSGVRQTIRGIHTEGIVLDAFWKLQDSLVRLVEALDDSRSESLDILSQDNPRLVSRTVDVLQLAERSRVTKNSGVKTACEEINQSLLSLAQLGYRKTVGS